MGQPIVAALPQPPPIEYRAGVPGDVAGMSALRKGFVDPSRGTHRSCEPEYYRWKVFDNPLGPGIAQVAEAGGRIVGMLTVSARPVLVSGVACLAGELGDGFVHPDLQRRGIFGTLIRRVTQQADAAGYAFTYGTPGPQSFPVLKRLGYQVVRSLGLRWMLRPLAAHDLLGRRTPASVAGRVAQSAYDLCFPARSGLSSSPARPSGAAHALVSRCYAEGGHDIRAAIDADYLSWRYDTNPDTYDVQLTEHAHHGQGYFVLKAGRARGRAVGYIADFGCTGSRRMLRMTLARALHCLRALGVSLAAVWAGSVRGDVAALLSLGFLPVRSPVVIVRPGPTAPDGLLTRTWRFCLADSDNV